VNVTNSRGSAGSVVPRLGFRPPLAAACDAVEGVVRAEARTRRYLPPGLVIILHFAVDIIASDTTPGVKFWPAEVDSNGFPAAFASSCTTIADCYAASDNVQGNISVAI